LSESSNGQRRKQFNMTIGYKEILIVNKVGMPFLLFFGIKEGEPLFPLYKMNSSSRVHPLGRDLSEIPFYTFFGYNAYHGKGAQTIVDVYRTHKEAEQMMYCYMNQNTFGEIVWANLYEVKTYMFVVFYGPSQPIERYGSETIFSTHIKGSL
jgi:hypothetical protein